MTKDFAKQDDGEKCFGAKNPQRGACEEKGLDGLPVERKDSPIKAPIYLALDAVSPQEALALAEASAPYVSGFKLGLEYFLGYGREGYNQIAGLGLPVFLDLKLHDIPNTVKGAIRSLAGLEHPPSFLTVHAQGGSAMLQAALEACALYLPQTTLLAVTVLTSLNNDDLLLLGLVPDAEAQVLRLGKLAQNAGLKGLVCSPFETEILRRHLGKKMALMVPGIRPDTLEAPNRLPAPSFGQAEEGAEKTIPSNAKAAQQAKPDDQKRSLSPQQALANGATWLVIGRPITQAPCPAKAAQLLAKACLELA